MPPQPWAASAVPPVLSGNGRALFGREHHQHLAPFEAREAFDLGDFLDIVADAVEEIHAELLVRHFAAAEPQRALHLVAVLEELDDIAHLHLVIVGVDVRPHLDFLDLDGLLLLAGLGGLLLGLILQLAQIDELANRHLAIGIDLDEIESRFLSEVKRLGGRYDAPVLAFCVDKLNLGGTNISVGARPVIRGRGRSERSANGSGLLDY